ncbi:glycosyltransferase 87 family protein [Streptomyces huiliensis]|uniref:glycosyltransferase 87 family protein n=1 Tax=Streptomyces huiliensis TaxID=2876027 RepID=UPI001CBED733|nr:glycosyltransferase 87 family protein [Streptomyces huiliensis]MBZ4322914.1 glycosyltransferase 87 family protein [Streptomyces huiliensis]
MFTALARPGRPAARMRGRRWDRPLLVLCAAASLVVGLLSRADTSQRIWGLTAAAGYGCAALYAALLPRPWARGPAVTAVVGALVVPLLWLVVIGKAQMEVGVVERGADLLLSSGTPYGPDPREVRDFNPYLPGMALFGLPHALFGGGVFTGARLWFLGGFLAALAAAARAAGSGRRALWWLTACPLVALPLAIGGVDPPVVGLLCLSLTLAHRDRPVAAGLALGAAATLKWTAWPALPVLAALFAARHGGRAAARCAAWAVGPALLAVIPVALVDGAAFWKNAVLYPLGLGAAPSTAESPLIGHLIATLVPHGGAVAVALLLLGAAAVGASLLLRPPADAVAAADRLALGLAVAILLAPASRVGYAIYPVLLLAWPRLALRSRRAREAADAPAAAERAEERVSLTRAA